MSGDALAALAAKWRATGTHIQSFHATMGSGWIVCADELDALIAAHGSAPAQQEQGFAGRLDRGFAGLPEHLQPSNLPVRAAAVVLAPPQQDQDTWTPEYLKGYAHGLKDAESSGVLQAVLDAIHGTLDPSTPIADHPNVKFAQMQRLKLFEEGRAAAVDPREDPTYVPTYEDGIGWGSHARRRGAAPASVQGGPSEQPRPVGDRGGPVPGR